MMPVEYRMCSDGIGKVNDRDNRHIDNIKNILNTTIHLVTIM